MNDCSKILHFMTILGELRDYSKTIVLGNIDYKKYLEIFIKRNGKSSVVKIKSRWIEPLFILEKLYCIYLM